MSNMPDNTLTRLNPDAPVFSPTRASDPRPDNQASTMLVQSQASSIPAYTLQQDQNQLQLQHPASKACPQTLSKFELNGTTYYASQPPILAYSQFPTYYAHNNMSAFYGSYQDGFSNHSNNGYPNNGLGTSLWAGNGHNSLNNGTGHGVNFPHPYNYTQPSPYTYTPSTISPAYSNFYANDESNRSSFQPFAGQLQQVQRIKSGQDDPSLAHNGEGKKKKNKRNNKKKYAKYKEDKAQAAAQQNPFAAVKQKEDGNDRADGNGHAEDEESCDDGQATEKASTNGIVNGDNYAQGDGDVGVQKNRRVNGGAANNGHIDPDTDSDTTVRGNVATLKNRRVDNETHNNEGAHSNGHDYTNGNGNGNTHITGGDS